MRCKVHEVLTDAFFLYLWHSYSWGTHPCWRWLQISHPPSVDGRHEPYLMQVLDPQVKHRSNRRVLCEGNGPGFGELMGKYLSIKKFHKWSISTPRSFHLQLLMKVTVLHEKTKERASKYVHDYHLSHKSFQATTNASIGKMLIILF